MTPAQYLGLILISASLLVGAVLLAHVLFYYQDRRREAHMGFMRGGYTGRKDSARGVQLRPGEHWVNGKGRVSGGDADFTFMETDQE